MLNIYYLNFSDLVNSLDGAIGRALGTRSKGREFDPHLKLSIVIKLIYEAFY